MRALVLGLILLSFSTAASGDYKTTPDGRSVYIGECLLHEDYEDTHYTATNVLDYIDYPTENYLKKPPLPIPRVGVPNFLPVGIPPRL